VVGRGGGGGGGGGARTLRKNSVWGIKNS